MYSSGLGMSISQKIVRAHGGEILVYSEVGSGTRFEIVFVKV
jgi:signal transduction histidine kinase